MADAVVIGAGQNGLVAANLLADQGWDVLVLEEATEPGGAVRSAELIEPGYVNDLFSAFYPFTAASPHGEGLDALTVYSSELARGLIPRDPYLVMGQYAGFDETRAPAGKETAWAYTHVPQPRALRGDALEELTGSWDEAETQRMADRIEEQVEALAPGFRALIRGRHVFAPPSLEAANRNLSGGSINGGTAQLHQQLVFRPIPGLGRPDTPVANVFPGSSYAHPGGGVHGGPGANAARAALKSVRPHLPRGRVARALQR